MADRAGHDAGAGSGRGDVGFRFAGRELRGPAGATIAAGLLANGIRELRATRFGGRPRGLFCGIGNCFDCLVDVGEATAVRACQRTIADGHEIHPARPGRAGAAGPAGAQPGVEVVRAPLVVVGAGPAGMAACLAAADAGCHVVLVDAGPSLGGQVYRQSEVDRGDAGARPVDNRLDPLDAEPDPPHPGRGTLARPGAPVDNRLDPLDAEPDPPLLRPVLLPRRSHLRVRRPGRPGRGARAGAGSVGGAGVLSARLPRRFHRLATHPLVRRLHGATVWAASPIDGGGFRLHARTPAGPVRLDASAVVIATGAVELALPFPGWDFPGVVTAGGAQALLKGQGTVIGRRVVVAGSGPFLLPVAAGLAAAGARVVAVCEAVAAGASAARLPALAMHPGKLREAAGYLATLLRHRAPLLTGHGVVACHGDRQVEAVTIARLDRTWRPVPGSERRVDADAVCVGHGFVPDLALSRALGCEDRPDPARPAPVAVHDRDLAATVPGVFVAGEVTGVGGADVAELEGRLAGVSAARHLGLLDGAAHERRAAPLRRRLRRARRFAALLGELYPVGRDWPAWLRPETVVCRCEEATWERVERAVAAGADDLRAVRGVTRCGMGYCQGRVCGPPLQLAVSALAGRPLAEVGDFQARAINLPVPLGTVAEALGQEPGPVRPAAGRDR